MIPHMDRLAALTAFVRTADARSFAAAARTLGLSPSAIGKSVARLEAELGVRLLQRTTRSVSLTAEGALFLEPCRRALDALAEADLAVSALASSPRGRLRLSLPTIGYRFLVPLLPGFARLYPDIRLDLDFSDRMVDLVEEGFDAAIRSGVPADSRMVARRIGGFRMVLCAAPSYLARAGTPRGVDDLSAHACLRFRQASAANPQPWVLRGMAATAADAFPTPLVASNMEALRAAAIAGLGIAAMPRFLAAEALSQGALTEVLPEALAEGGDFWLVWPSNRHLSPKLRVFVDFLVANFDADQRGMKAQ